MRVSPALLALIEWVARIGAVTEEAHRMWRADRALPVRPGPVAGASPTPMVGPSLASAVRRQLLVRRRALVGAPALYTPTRAALRLAGQGDLALCAVTPANARHLIACANVAAVLERRYPGARVQGERQLRRDERAAGRALASASVRAAGTPASAHRPDLVLWPSPAPGRCSAQGAGGRTVAMPAPGPVAVEVELALKAPRRLRAICAAWADCGCVAGTLYVVAPGIESALARAVSHAAAQRRIAIAALDTLLEEQR